MTIHADWDGIKLWAEGIGMVVIFFIVVLQVKFYPTRLAKKRGVNNPLILSANLMVSNSAEWLALLAYAQNATPTDQAEAQAEARQRATMSGAFGDALDARMRPQRQPEPPIYYPPHPYGPRPIPLLPPRLAPPSGRREPRFDD